MTDGGFSEPRNEGRVSEPLLLTIEQEPSTNIFSLSSRKAWSFWVFSLLSIGILGFLGYSTYLIITDTITGSYNWFDIEKPNNDPKIYKYLPELLPNAPPIVVVQDPGAQLTGFAVGVSAGSYYDPMDFPGLAHFTEHMLFLGTEKFPGPTSFDEFISSHGGSSNAFTDAERTVYYNAIDTEVFAEGLSRFIEFFTRPLFNQTYIEKEVKAVDSEHDMHINDPNWRLFSIVGSLSLPPHNHYSTGDSSTLLPEGVEALGDAVRRYFSSNYCFNRLSIAIVSPLPVSDQVETVRNIFSSISAPIPRNCRQALNFTKISPQLSLENGFPIPSANRGKLVYSEGPAGSQPVLWLAFPYRSVLGSGETGKHPFSILETVLTYNGENSLKQSLIAAGLTTNMQLMADDNTGGCLVYLTFELSSSGREKVDELVARVFSFLRKIRDQKISTTLIEQIQQLRDSLFYSNADSRAIVNESPIRLAKYFASQMTLSRKNSFNASELITVNERILKIDADLVNDILSQMNEKNTVVLFHDPFYKSPPDWLTLMQASAGKSGSQQTDPHYGFKYTVGDFVPPSLNLGENQDKIQVLRNLSVLPPKIERRSSTTTGPRANLTEIMAPPENVISMPGLEIWSKPSSSSMGKGVAVPKVWIYATVRPSANTVASISPEELQLNGELLVDSVNFELRSKCADFLIAGYDFLINWMLPGYIEVKISGWKDRVEELMKIIVREVSRPNLRYFDLILSEKIDSISRARSLTEVAGEAMNSLVIGSPTREDVKTVLNTYSQTRGGLVSWTSSIFSAKNYFTVYVGGPSAEDAKLLGRNFFDSFNISSVLSSKSEAVFFLAGPKFAKPVEVRITNPADNDPNSALLYALTYGTDMTSHDRVISALLASILDPMIFRYIRTELQMGYIASGKVGLYPGPAGAVQFRVYIQGNVAEPDLMEARLEEVLSSVPGVLGNLSLSDIQERAAGVSASVEEQPGSAHVEVSQFWQSIHDESLCFDKAKKQSNSLKSTDPATLRSQLIHVFNAFWRDRRSKITVKVWKSEGASKTVPPWNRQALETAIGTNSSEILSSLAAEKSKTVFINSVSKKDRQAVFDTALDPTDPMWDPRIPSCDT